MHTFKMTCALIPLAVLAVLASCTDNTPSSSPAQTKAHGSAGTSAAAAPEAALMRAVYGKQYRAASNDALAQLPTFDKRTVLKNDSTRERLFVIKPLATTTFKTGDTVLVALASPAEEDANGNFVGFDDIGLLNVFVLRQTKGEWKVLKRHINLAQRGDDNRPGSILFPMLASDKPGLAVITGGKWGQGCESESLLLFDLSQDGAPIVADGITTKWIAKDGCWTVDLRGAGSLAGTWRLVPPARGGALDDLIVVYSGARTPPRSGRHDVDPLVENHNKTVNRYAYDGRFYQLVEGKHPLSDQEEAEDADQ